MRKIFEQLKKDESGASLIEYVLIAGLISVATVAAMTATNTSVQGVWASITTALAS
jgi:pilus assembly protein Flp/PilA